MLHASLRIAILVVVSTWSFAAAAMLDIAASGRVSRDAHSIGIEWDEERDVSSLRVAYSSVPNAKPSIEYWFRNWPYEPARMPSFEDPMDDPWQGQWLKAAAQENCSGIVCTYTFDSLTAAENALAKNLPGVLYRRTLKARLLFANDAPAISRLQVFNGTSETARRLRIEWDHNAIAKAPSTGEVSIYNGTLASLRGWQFGSGDSVNGAAWKMQASDRDKGLLLDLRAATPALPGSHDLTVVTVHTLPDRTFSFLVDDLAHGPIVIPEFHVRIIDVEAKAAPVVAAEKIRARIPREPDQTYERAAAEIPPLDPYDREWGGPVYLPLAADSNWQKFAFEYGGDVYVSKTGIKAKGRELARMQWEGDRRTWKLTTGSSLDYREQHRVTVSTLDDYLPVVTQKWIAEGLDYSQEAFATMLHGPLSPDDPARDEETPAILLMRLEARNASSEARDAHVTLTIQPAAGLELRGSSLFADGKLVAELPAGQSPVIRGDGVHITLHVPARGSTALVLKLPCVSDLSSSDVADLIHLDYTGERARIVAYWKSVADPASRFTTPEPKFNALERSVIAHIHISTTKDPATGLYMVPAASYGYDVYENEACYQVLLLDALGQFDTAAKYLETMLRLQGSKNFPGDHRGSDAAIFHGVKISDVYDYTASGYGLDHPTVLWTLAQHYLYTRDRKWFAHAWPHMRAAIDWIEQQRAATMRLDEHGQPVREYGLLPASQLEDDADWANWFTINAYAWAGMARTAEALADIQDPDADRIRNLAAAYRGDLRRSIYRAVAAAPVVRMQDGSYEPYVPVLPTRRFRLFGAIRRDYYRRYGGDLFSKPELQPLMRLGADRDTLCGSVVFLILGLFSPDEPITQWILNDWEDNLTLSSGMGMNIHGMTDDRNWFSQGGMVFQANLLNPIQVYLRLHEVPASIRNLYNDFVACLYPETNQFTEEFHQWRHGSGPFFKISDEARFVTRVRDSLVFEEGSELWLASGPPGRWLGPGPGIRVDRVATYFGPVSFNMQAGSTPKTVDAEVSLPNHPSLTASWLVVRPPQGHLKSVMIDGAVWNNFDPARDAIHLPAKTEPMRIRAAYE